VVTVGTTSFSNQKSQFMLMFRYVFTDLKTNNAYVPAQIQLIVLYPGRRVFTAPYELNL